MLVRVVHVVIVGGLSLLSKEGDFGRFLLGLAATYLCGRFFFLLLFLGGLVVGVVGVGVLVMGAFGFAVVVAVVVGL